MPGDSHCSCTVHVHVHVVGEFQTLSLKVWGPFLESPRNFLGSAKLKPFLVHLYLRVEECKRLKSLFILRLSGVD